MHAKPISKRPKTAAITDDWGTYEDSWAYLMLFIIASILVPQKL